MVQSGLAFEIPVENTAHLLVGDETIISGSITAAPRNRPRFSRQWPYATLGQPDGPARAALRCRGGVNVPDPRWSAGNRSD